MADRRRARAKRIEELATIEPGSLGDFALRYLEDLALHNYSPHTIRTARIHLRLFLVWCEARGLVDPELVTLATLRAYQRHLFHWRKEDGRRLSFISQSDRLAGVRRLFRWLHEQGHLEANPGAKIHLPRAEKRLPRGILTAAEAERVMAQPDLDTKLGLRDRAILETLYSTGLRRSELERLRIRDLDLSGGTLLVRQGKGKKDRRIPLSERAAAWLEKYLDEVRPHLVNPARGPDDGTVFLGVRGTSLQGQQMAKLVRVYLRAARVSKEGACHLFRHTCATLMLEGGADIRYVQRMLGHATLQSTEIYTHVAIRKLQEVHARTHPGAKLRRRSEPLAVEEEAAEASGPL